VGQIKDKMALPEILATSVNCLRFNYAYLLTNRSCNLWQTISSSDTLGLRQSQQNEGNPRTALSDVGRFWVSKVKRSINQEKLIQFIRMGCAHNDSTFLQIAAEGANPEIEALLAV
jgi:hypothetical protein